MLLFESLKSSPGLIGLWADLVKNKRVFPPNVDAFVAQVPWLRSISDTNVGFSDCTPLERSCGLLIRYFDELEKLPAFSPELQDQLVTSNLAAKTVADDVSSGVLEISSFAFVVIIDTYVRQPSMHKPSLDLCKQLKGIIDVIKA